jgi:hypothetical protein
LSVSKGSINRVNRIKQSNQTTDISEKAQDAQALNTAAEVNPTKDQPKKNIDLQEEKFKLISRIKQDIPDYLL